LRRDFRELQVLIISKYDDFAVFWRKLLQRLGKFDRAKILVRLVDRLKEEFLRHEFFLKEQAFLLPNMPMKQVPRMPRSQV
jgi:hypothetical protein